MLTISSKKLHHRCLAEATIPTLLASLKKTPQNPLENNCAIFCIEEQLRTVFYET